MLHGKSLAAVVAYNLYLEVAEGKLDLALEIDEPVDFWTFREKLLIQMLEYSLTFHLPFKAVSCDACHSLHSLETVCLATENSIAAAPKIPRGITPFTRCSKR
jgi:hypothetical protein